MAEFAEPQITINGQPLTEAQAIAVRIAVTDLLSQIGLGEQPFGDDEVGAKMEALHKERLTEVIKIMGVA